MSGLLCHSCGNFTDMSKYTTTQTVVEPLTVTNSVLQDVLPKNLRNNLASKIAPFKPALSASF